MHRLGNRNEILISLDFWKITLFSCDVLDDSISNKGDNFKLIFFEIEDTAIECILNYVQRAKLLCFLYDLHKLQEMSEKTLNY